MTSSSGPDLAAWHGRTERVEDDLSPAQARAVAAMLDLPDLANVTFPVGDAIPPLWQWFYFLPKAPQSALDTDGHPKRGGFLPPITLPRRMFAGARMTMHTPLRLGIPAVRTGTIVKVEEKDGRSGRLAFVTVAYRFEQDGELCIEEEQDIVYREQGAPVTAPEVLPWSPVPDGARARLVTPDSRLLFRFSALTFNAHRIHYDREYARNEEGYPGLVVHGPLTAVLLMHLAASLRPNAPLTRFSFRGLAPIFDLAPFRLVAVPEHTAQIRLEAQRADGSSSLQALATF